MAIVEYKPTQTMLQARTAYFLANGLGEAGGYDDAWVDFKLGPIPLPFPNTKARLRAVRYRLARGAAGLSLHAGVRAPGAGDLRVAPRKSSTRLATALVRRVPSPPC
jgi:hypothetical protein